MDLLNNYYSILGITHQATDKEIKLSYYDKSKTCHPDKGGSQDEFKLISEAYKILMSKDLRPEYDKRSKFGKNYDELWDLLKFEFSNNNKVYDKEALDKFKKNEILDIVYKIDDSFNGNIEYERWIACKTCNGTGGVDGKFAIKDAKGKVISNLQTGDECDFCFEGHNKVITKRGAIPIKDVELGDFVLNKDNKYHEVINLMNREYSGELYDINVMGIEVNGITPNHKFNIVRFNRKKSNRVICNQYEILEVPVSEIQLTDFVLYQTQTNISKESIHIDSGRNKNQNPFDIKIDADFVKFVACFIAEGHTRGKRVTCFTFHIDKDDDLVKFIAHYCKTVLNFNYSIIEIPDKKTKKVEIFSSQLSKFMNSFCGHTAKNKFINLDVIGCDDNILMKTLLSCDGYTKNNKYHIYTTISEKLAMQLLHISIKLGYNTSINTVEEHIDKTGQKHQLRYNVCISESQKRGLYTKKVKEGICLKVKSISNRYTESTIVYNITVKDIHKYTIEGLLVNNCEGTGKREWDGQDCTFCSGKGKFSAVSCGACKGEKRILHTERFKISPNKITGDKFKVDFRGNQSKDGKVGNLWLIKKTG